PPSSTLFPYTTLFRSNLEVVKSFDSALSIYANLAQAGRRLDKNTLSRLFADPELRAKFDIKPADELITYNSVNGNKARTKFAPRSEEHTSELQSLAYL